MSICVIHSGSGARGERTSAVAGELDIARRTSGRLLVLSRGQLVVGYTVGPWRSYLYPVLTPAGFPLTEESPVDHPHHNSIWLGQDGLNGHNLWLTHPGCGRVKVVALEQLVIGDAVVFRETNQWLSPRGKANLAEARTTRVAPAAAGRGCHVS